MRALSPSEKVAQKEPREDGMRGGSQAARARGKPPTHHLHVTRWCAPMRTTGRDRQGMAADGFGATRMNTTQRREHQDLSHLALEQGMPKLAGALTQAAECSRAPAARMEKK